MEKNKVKFGLNKVHYAKILSFDDEGVPTFAEPVRIPGAVSLSIDAEGEASNFTQMTACIMSSTTTLAILATWKSHSFRWILQPIFSASSWTRMAFFPKSTPQKLHSLPCSLSSAATKTRFGTACSAAPPLVQRLNPAPLKQKRKLKQKPCP